MSDAVQKPAETPPEPVRNKGGRPPKDWAAARHLYVHGMVEPDGQHTWFTLAEVGQRLGLASIERRASTEKWRDDRDMYQTKLAQMRQEKRVDLLAAKAAEFDANALKVFDALIQQVKVHLARSAMDKKPLLPGVLARLVMTVRQAHVGGRLAMGDTTEITKQVGVVTHEFDLSSLSDDELATLEMIRGKMQGVIIEQPSDGTVH